MSTRRGSSKDETTTASTTTMKADPEPEPAPDFDPDPAVPRESWTENAAYLFNSSPEVLRAALSSIPGDEDVRRSEVETALSEFLGQDSPSPMNPVPEET